MKTNSKRTRPTAKRIGANPALTRRRVLAGIAILAVPASAQKQDKKLYAVIAGTVFRDPGFALPGAAVELREIRADGKKAKPQRAVTDARGEFAFRLPPAARRNAVPNRGLRPWLTIRREGNIVDPGRPHGCFLYVETGRELTTSGKQEFPSCAVSP